MLKWVPHSCFIQAGLEQYCAYTAEKISIERQPLETADELTH